MHERGSERVVLLQHAQIVDVYTRTAGLSPEQLQEGREWALQVMLTASGDGLNQQVLAVVEDVADKDVVMAFGLSLALAKSSVGLRRPEDFLAFAKTLIDEDKALAPEGRNFTDHDEIMLIEIGAEFVDTGRLEVPTEADSKLTEVEVLALLKRTKGMRNSDIVNELSGKRHPVLDKLHDNAIKNHALTLTAYEGVRWLRSQQAHSEEGQQVIDTLHDTLAQRHAHGLTRLEAVRWLENIQPKTEDGAERLAQLHDAKVREYAQGCTMKDAVSFLTSVSAMTEAGRTAIDELHDAKVLGHARQLIATEAIRWLANAKPRTVIGQKEVDDMHDKTILRAARGMTTDRAIVFLSSARARTMYGQAEIDDLIERLRNR